MQKHEKALLDLIGRALFSAEVHINSDINISDLYKEACDQSVAILVWHALTPEERSSIPEEIKSKWRARALKQISMNHALLEEQKAVFNLLSQNGIRHAILKGSSVACNYPDPLLRTFGDIDILVSRNNQKKSVEVLRGVGYGDVLEDRHHCHYTITKGKITVEIHQEPNGIHIVIDPEIAEKLHSYFETALDDIIETEDGPTLNTEYQSVVLLMHKLEHFLYGGFGLRQLCDWACFVNKQFTSEAFERIRPLLEELGLLEFAGIITRVCCDYLHLPVADASWCMEYDENLANEVMEEIISSGNFGIKNKQYGQRFFEDYSSSNRISSAFKTLCASSRYHWPPCEKYPILMPIGFAVNIFRYLKLRIRGKRPKIHPMKLFKSSGPKQKLYKSLKPYQRVEKESEHEN